MPDPGAPPVLCTQEGRVALVMLNRPETDNSLSAPVLAALSDQLRRVARTPQIRALVLAGAGTNFSLGGSFAEFREALSCEESHGRSYCEARTAALADVISTVHNLPVPVIAAVNGQAAGAGFSLALACDMRIADTRTRFHFAYGALGASTDGGMSWLLPRIVGGGVAMRLLLEQPVIRAERARELGLVDDIVPSAQLVPQAIALATNLAERAAHANRTTKHLLHRAHHATLEDHMAAEHRAFADGLMSADMRHALDARARGENPVFG